MKYARFLCVAILLALWSCKDPSLLLPAGITEEEVECHNSILSEHGKHCDKPKTGAYFEGSLDGKAFCIYDGYEGYTQSNNISWMFFTTTPEVSPGTSEKFFRLELGFCKKNNETWIVDQAIKYAHADNSDRIYITMRQAENLSMQEFIDKHIQVGDLKLKRQEIPDSYDPELINGFTIHYDWMCSGPEGYSNTSSIRLDPEDAYLRCTKLVKERTPEGYHYSMEFEMRCKLYFGLNGIDYFKTLDYGKMVVELDVPE